MPDIPDEPQFCMDPATIGFDVSAETYVDAAGSAGFTCIEWPAVVLSGSSRDEVRRLKSMSTALGVDLVQMTAGVGEKGNIAVPEDDFKAALPAFRQACMMARSVGSHRAALFVDMARNGGVELHDSAILARATLVADIASSNGLRLNLGWLDTQLLRKVASLRQECQCRFDLIIDTFILYRAGLGADFVRSLPLGSVGWVRIGDAPGDVDLNSLRYEHRLLPGAGVVDVIGIVAACRANGYDGPLSIETRDPRLEHLAPRERAWRAFDSMRSLFGFAAE